MIQVQDNFLTEETFKTLIDYCDKEFTIVNIQGKDFSLLETPKDLLPLLEIQGYNQVVSFVRSAYNGFDEEMRVHADNIIDGKRIGVASVLYINNDPELIHNGTAFYKHHKYGLRLPKFVSNEEYDRTITCDSNDEAKWEMMDKISGIPNRYLIYEANMFHGKFPKKIETGVRKVIVTFYEKKTV